MVVLRAVVPHRSWVYFGVEAISLYCYGSFSDFCPETPVFLPERKEKYRLCRFFSIIVLFFREPGGKDQGEKGHIARSVNRVRQFFWSFQKNGL
jgi:hypothetical protein